MMIATTQAGGGGRDGQDFSHFRKVPYTYFFLQTFCK